MPVRARSQREPEDASGAPDWMVTFSDCMTLLLTFFVLLISFSSFDVKVFRRMESALAEGLQSVSLRQTPDDPALREKPEIVSRPERTQGSENPTVDGRYESSPPESLDFLEFERQKVFLLPSSKVFWGRGTAMSSHGRSVLSDIGALLAASSNRIIVSEHSLVEDGGDADIGLRRAWQITEFLTEQQGLDQNRFSISGGSTVSRETLGQSALLTTRSRTDRALEIVILDRSIYR